LEKSKNCRAGRAGLTCWNWGCGLPLRKFKRVHMASLRVEMFDRSFNWDKSGIRAPWLRTRSRQLGESLAMFPNAHAACSRTWWLGELSRLTNIGTVPWWITTLMWLQVPDAMYASNQAALNWTRGKSSIARNLSKRGTARDWINESITFSAGGQPSAQQTSSSVL
jgi:hypothetical protein